MIGGHDIGSRCIKMEKSKIEQSSDSANSVDLNGCKMTCGKFGALWPRPTGYVNLSEALFEVFPDNIALEMQSSNSENNPDKGIKSMDNEITILLYSIIILFLVKNDLIFELDRARRKLVSTTERDLSPIPLPNASFAYQCNYGR